MERNLFVSYDLKAQGKNYDKVIAAIKATCPRWAKVHYSLFYVKTSLTAQQVFDKVKLAIDANDSLMVIDATGDDAHWVNVDPVASKYLIDHWQKKAA